MRPVQGGRLCGQCERRVIDFRDASDQQIAVAHTESDVPICGAYSPEQFARWAPPALVTLTLGAMLLGGAAQAQPRGVKTASGATADQAQVTPETRAASKENVTAADTLVLMVHGTVQDTSGEPVARVSVSAVGTPYRVVTDTLGRYAIRLPLATDASRSASLQFTRVGFESARLPVSPDATGEIRLNVALRPAQIELVGIVVTPVSERPSLWRRLLDAIRSVF